MTNLMHELKWYPLSRQNTSDEYSNAFGPGEMNKMKKIFDDKSIVRMKDSDEDEDEYIRATEWFAPIHYLQQRTGLTRVVEALGPIGDPPITLDSSSVSEGTL